MNALMCLCICILLLQVPIFAVSKPHSVVLGKWVTVKVSGANQDQTEPKDLKVRPVSVDGRNKEWTLGTVHEVTEETFVLQRAYRLNDSLPQESGALHWRWEIGTWLLIDRISGKMHAINLPDFDPYASTVSWFRDYVAYCGVSDDGKKAFAILMQLGRRKPLLKKDVGPLKTGSDACPAPRWERSPARVIFAPAGDEAFTYTVRTRALDLLTSDEDDDE